MSLSFVLDDFLKATDSEIINEKDLETTGKIISNILNNNPSVFKHISFQTEARKVIIAVGVGSGWSTWNTKKLQKHFLFYQPIIDFLESGGKFILTGRNYEDIDCQYKSYEEPGRSILKKFWEDAGEEGPGLHLYGAENLKVEIVNGPFQVRSEDEGYEWIKEFDGSDWL